MVRIKATIFLFPIILVLFAASTAFGQVGKLYPLDDSAKDPSFFAFRSRLMDAVQRKDRNFIISCLDPKIQNSFGGDDGIAEFKQMWKPEDPKSELWPTLTTVLALGCVFENATNFSAPYTFSKFPDKFDSFEYAVITGANVRVRQIPGLDAPVLMSLSFDIVKVIEWGPDQKPVDEHKWIKIALANGTQGFVAEEYIRSPIDYRAIFIKKGGRWIITALVAGD